MKKLNCVNIATGKIDEMKRFYALVLEGTIDESHGGPGRVEIVYGDEVLIVLQKTDKPTYVNPDCCGLEFKVENVLKEYERLKSTGVDATEPVTYPWNCKAIAFRDPDGNNVDFVEFL